MRFLVICGCDNDEARYSMGRYRVEWIEAETPEEVIEKIAYPEGRDEYCHFDDDLDFSIDEAYVIPEEYVGSVNCEKFKAECRLARREKKEAEIEARDRAEYERLQKKYACHQERIGKQTTKEGPK